MAQKALEVKDLRISFRTSNGKVQAVRDISFDLYRGETLAIVGESGSGKSVTSRAVMGILAGNAIVEGGKILYGDKDLMKISEEEFHDIRGDKIAMVFQDPLSSLNPIMRIGAQLTEAMLLKNKASRREGKKNMDETFEALSVHMKAAGVTGSDELIAKFKKMELKHCTLQSEYADSFAAAGEAQAIAEHLAKVLENKAELNVAAELAKVERLAKKSVSYFVVRQEAEQLTAELAKAKACAKSEKDTKDYPGVVAALKEIAAIMGRAVAFEVPNTFTLGYYLTFVDAKIPEMPVAELNNVTHTHAEKFFDPFMQSAKSGIAHSLHVTDEARAEAVKALHDAEAQFAAKTLSANDALKLAKDLKATVYKCLDNLEVFKDSLTHTFASSIDAALDLYYSGIEKNAKEKKRFETQSAKWQALKDAGKNPEWQVIPASYIDLDMAHAELLQILHEMADHFVSQLEENKNVNLDERSLAVIDYVKECAQQSVNLITKNAAKEKAIKLMESVGIDNPRRRFNQYPFEFSGGMRQRIVIAIALTANPDILICDEPTTALDVTIQAQILELINKLKKERNLSIIFITHDLGVVANMADRIAVMYAGKIVEYGTAEEVFYSPAHPYTWALLSSVPDLETKEKLESIPGTPPNMIYPPVGDAFAERNKYALEIDFEKQPPMFKVTDTHYAATWLLHPNAPKMDPPEVVTARIARIKKKGGAEQ